MRLAHLACLRGDTAEAARCLAEARAHFGTHDPMPQYALPMKWVALRVAAAEGRPEEARAELFAALDAGFPPGTQRYAWPLLLAATTAEADRYGDPATEPGRPEVLDRIRGAARNLATGVPLWQAHDQWLRAELLRAEGRSEPDAWSEAVAALEPLGRPHDLACVRLRLAEALLAAGGGEDDRARATELLRLVDAVAGHLGAAPLARDAALLARRGRLALTPAPARSRPRRPPTRPRRSA
ncbi:hypothetical protein LUX34_10325 [Streptomyces werraensis]|nr:hypothetical protein [Streptomyces werraensis]